MKREGALKSAFFKQLRLACPDYYVLGYITGGGPDREIVGNGRASRWEFKHATPDFVSHGNQALLCTRLAEADHCRYVMWNETALGTQKKTLIIHPRHVLDGSLRVEAWTKGFDHDWLVNYVKQYHEAHISEYHR